MTLPTIAGVQSRILHLSETPPIMLAEAVAEVFGTDPRNLMRQVRRNMDLFPDGFLIELTGDQYLDQLRQLGTTAERKRTDLAQLGFTQQACLMVPHVLRTPQARAAAPIIARAFVEMREGLIGQMREELEAERVAYIEARKIRVRIVEAARLGWSYTKVYDLWGGPHRLLVTEIERLRARGYIDRLAMPVPMYILRKLDLEREFLDGHAQDTLDVLRGEG